MLIRDFGWRVMPKSEARMLDFSPRLSVAQRSHGLYIAPLSWEPISAWNQESDRPVNPNRESLLSRNAGLHESPGRKNMHRPRNVGQEGTSLKERLLHRCVVLQKSHKRLSLWRRVSLSEARTVRWLILSVLLAVAVSKPNVAIAQAPESEGPSRTSRAGSATGSASGGTPTPSPSLSMGLTDEPIFAGEIVQVAVFNAPDFSTVTRVSQSGDIGVPYLGVVHVVGLSSASAAELITGELKRRNLVLDPRLLVTVDSTKTGITVLGEVKSPGVYPPTGKHMLSDILAGAGGLTTNIGRVIEISNDATPEQKTYVPWDPTMHNTSSYDRVIEPGQRVLVRPCGFVYVGGSVGRPGAFATCGSPTMRLSEMIALAGGVIGSANMNHTIISRSNPDGSKTIYQIRLDKVLRGDAQDSILHEDDIIYVPPSYLKATLKRLPDYAVGLGSTLLYVYR